MKIKPEDLPPSTFKGQVKTLTEEHFSPPPKKGGKVSLNVSDLVIVMFWAGWCGPCRVMIEIFRETSKGFSDITFVEINTDHQPKIHGWYGITSIPTFIFFQDGQPVKTKTCAMSSLNFKKEIGSFLSP